MEFTGRIKQMLPMRQGTSQRTGNEWYAQPFVFEYFEHETDRYADSVVLETYDSNIIPHLKEGLEKSHTSYLLKHNLMLMFLRP